MNELETLQENYRKTSGVQESQWSKGKQPVQTPANFIETNLINIGDAQFVENIAMRYGVSKEDLFPNYLAVEKADGSIANQSRILLRQIENILSGERRYQFVIKGDTPEEYIYPLDGFEITEEAVVHAIEETKEDLEVAGNIYQVCSTVQDRYTGKTYEILEGAREELQIAEMNGEEGPELLNTSSYITKYEREAERGTEYYEADLEIPLSQEENTKVEEENQNFWSRIKGLFKQIFQKEKPQQLPPPKKEKRINQYKLDSSYNLAPEDMSQIAKERLLADLKETRKQTGRGMGEE